MKSVNSLSGGKTSSYIAVHYPADYNVFSLVCIDDVRCKPKDEAIIKYVNHKLESYTEKYGEFIATAEDDRTIIAMMDLEQFLGKRIIWVRGASFDDVIDKPLSRGENPTRLPSWARRYCTDQMKLYPIFMWWFNNVGERINMRIGFRFDEYDRMERFMNNSEKGGYSIPVSCSFKPGIHKISNAIKSRQKHEKFDWRFCSFPLIKNAITKADIEDYWRVHGYLGKNSFFEKKIEFPVISNCVGCFHKKPETLAVMFAMHPEKMNWFAKQEEKGMGTWLDSRTLYKTIGLSTGWSEEMIKEEGAACDSGGCTD